jgi:hypothetical protein
MARHRFERLGRALLIGSWCLSAVAAWSDSTSESTTAALVSGADIIHGTDFAQSGDLRHGFALRLRTSSTPAHGLTVRESDARWCNDGERTCYLFAWTNAALGSGCRGALRGPAGGKLDHPRALVIAWEALRPKFDASTKLREQKAQSLMAASIDRTIPPECAAAAAISPRPRACAPTWLVGPGASE